MAGMASPGLRERKKARTRVRGAELTGVHRPQVDLQPGQNEQEGQAKQGHHVDRLIDLHPGKDRRQRTPPR